MKQEFKGFLYRETPKQHKYYLDGVEMTGTTTFLKSSGDTSGLQVWSANQGASKAFIIANNLTKQPDKGLAYLEALATRLEGYKKLDYKAVQEVDKEFPEFKEARNAFGDIRDTAADSGTEAHSIIEHFELTNGLPVGIDQLYSAEAIKKAKVIVDWHKENVEQVYFSEKPLFSRSMFVGGKPDGGVRTKDGKNLIKDNKFKSGLYSPHPILQMTGYAMMIEEMAQDDTTPIRLELRDGTIEEYKSPKEYLGAIGGVKWDGLVILWVNDDGRLEPIYRYAMEHDKEQVRNCLSFYRYEQNWKSLK